MKSQFRDELILTPESIFTFSLSFVIEVTPQVFAGWVMQTPEGTFRLFSSFDREQKMDPDQIKLRHVKQKFQALLIKPTFVTLYQLMCFLQSLNSSLSGFDFFMNSFCLRCTLLCTF